MTTEYVDWLSRAGLLLAAVAVVRMIWVGLEATVLALKALIHCLREINESLRRIDDALRSPRPCPPSHSQVSARPDLTGYATTNFTPLLPPDPKTGRL